MAREIFIPKQDLKVPITISATRVENGKQYILESDFIKGKTYIVDYYIDDDLNLIKDNQDEDYKTDFNKIERMGTYVVKAEKDIDEINTHIFPNIEIKTITNHSSSLRWGRDIEPFYNTLTYITKGKCYIIEVSKVLGVAAPIGTEIAGVGIVSDFNDGIKGLIIKEGDTARGVEVISDDKELLLRYFQKELPTTKIMSMSYKSDDDDYDFIIKYNETYFGDDFSIKIHNKIYEGRFGYTGIQERDLPECSIIFKAKKDNVLYNKLSMFVYVIDRLFHIRFDKNYVADDFYISYQDRLFTGRFKESLTVDNPEVLLEYK